MMELKISDFNISENVFLNKIKSDLNQGVRMKAGQAEKDKDIIRVWTDTINWQFSLAGLANFANGFSVERIQIQSFGNSKSYIQLDTLVERIENIIVNIEKLSTSFAEFSTVERPEADEFLQAYMNSTFNRYLTEQLFKEVASNQDFSNWLIK